MRLPRDISGLELADALKKLGYVVSHQTGSHIRLTTIESGEHHITIPAHDPIRVGTFNAILRDVSQHHAIERATLVMMLFQK